MPRVFAWLTPDTIPTDTICRVLVIPADIGIIAAVNGALLPLVYAENWEQYGAVTPDEIAVAMRAMFDAYATSLGDECVPLPEKPDVFYDYHVKNVAGGGITANTDTPVAFTQAPSENPGNVVLSSGAFLVAEGVYYFEIEHFLQIPANHVAKCWLGDSALAVVVDGESWSAGAQREMMNVRGYVTTPEGGATYYYVLRSTVTRATDALGIPANMNNHDEKYGFATWWKLADLG